MYIYSSSRLNYISITGQHKESVSVVYNFKSTSLYQKQSELIFKYRERISICGNIKYLKEKLEEVILHTHQKIHTTPNMAQNSAEMTHESSFQKIIAEFSQNQEEVRHALAQITDNIQRAVVFYGPSQNGKTVVTLALSDVPLDIKKNQKGILEIQNADPNHEARVGDGRHSQSTKPVMTLAEFNKTKFWIIDTPGTNDTGSVADSLRNYFHNYNLLRKIESFVFVLTLERATISRPSTFKSRVRKFLSLFNFDDKFTVETLAQSTLILITKDKNTKLSTIEEKIKECLSFAGQANQKEVVSFLGVFQRDLSKVMAVQLITQQGQSIEVSHIKEKIYERLMSCPLGNELREEGRLKIHLDEKEAAGNKGPQLDDIYKYNKECIEDSCALIMEMIEHVIRDQPVGTGLAQKISGFIESKSRSERTQRWPPQGKLVPQEEGNRIAFLVQSAPHLKKLANFGNDVNKVLCEVLEVLLRLYVTHMGGSTRLQVILNNLAWFVNELDYEFKMFSKIRTVANTYLSKFMTCLERISQVWTELVNSAPLLQTQTVQYYLNKARRCEPESFDYYYALQSAIDQASIQYQGKWNKNALLATAAVCEEQTETLTWAIYFYDILFKAGKVDKCYGKLLKTNLENKCNILLAQASYQLKLGQFERARRLCFQAKDEATDLDQQAQARTLWLSITPQLQATIRENILRFMHRGDEFMEPTCVKGMSDLTVMAKNSSVDSSSEALNDNRIEDIGEVLSEVPNKHEELLATHTDLEGDDNSFAVIQNRSGELVRIGTDQGMGDSIRFDC